MTSFWGRPTDSEYSMYQAKILSFKSPNRLIKSIRQHSANGAMMPSGKHLVSEMYRLHKNASLQYLRQCSGSGHIAIAYCYSKLIGQVQATNSPLYLWCKHNFSFSVCVCFLAILTFSLFVKYVLNTLFCIELLLSLRHLAGLWISLLPVSI